MTNPGIGSSPRRREDHRLLTGAASFGDDFTLPGQTFAAIASLSPCACDLAAHRQPTQPMRIARGTRGADRGRLSGRWAEAPDPLAVHGQSTRHNSTQSRRQGGLHRTALPACRTTACGSSARASRLSLRKPWRLRKRPLNSSRWNTSCSQPSAEGADAAKARRGAHLAGNGSERRA